MRAERKEHIKNIDFDIFSKRFEQALKDTGIKREDMADDGICCKEAMSCYCTGKRIPNGRNLLYICNYLNVSADWLLGLSDEKRAVW